MFAEQLKQARAATGLTQQGLSDLLEVPKRTIEDWERSKSTPPSYVQKLILNELSRHKAPTEGLRAKCTSRTSRDSKKSE